MAVANLATKLFSAEAILGTSAAAGRGLSLSQRQQNTQSTGWDFKHTTNTQHRLSLELAPTQPGRRWELLTPLTPLLAHSPEALLSAVTRLLDPHLPIQLPPPQEVTNPHCLKNGEMDKIIGALGRSRSTWRRAIVLHEWLLAIGHVPDDRLCTTLIRVCSQHGQAQMALNLYDWMKGRREDGGAGLRPTVFTYTAAIRAALAGNLTDRALQVWDDAVAARCETDSRMHTALIEVCTRTGDTARALQVYEAMRDAEPHSRLAPSVHAFTAAMRAAAEGGLWQRALEIWADMQLVGCKPTGHSYAAAISACAVGGVWQKAVNFFDEMLELQIKPDVVSCTALVSALAADAQWERAERVMTWMLQNGVKPNVRTYTALITALGNAGQWQRALDTLAHMKAPASVGHVEPNAYTYSALLKTMGDHGQWQLAEEIFAGLEAEALGLDAAPERPSERVSTPLPQRPQDHPKWGSPSSATSRSGLSSPEQPHPHRTPWLGPSPPQGFKAIRMHPDSQPGLGQQKDSAGSFGEMPTALAEQVLTDAPGTASPPSGSASSTGTDFGLPDDLPGLASSSSSPRGPYDPVGVYGPSSTFLQGPPPPPPGPPPRSDPALASPASKVKARCVLPKGPLNEVVCGAMMSAYERAGLYDQALLVLRRAERLRLQLNHHMVNIAMSALSKSGNIQGAQAMFERLEKPDAISYETLISGFGHAGMPLEAERLLGRELAAGLQPRALAYLGVIAAWSNAGDWRRALLVKNRLPPGSNACTTQIYNLLLMVIIQARQWDQGLALHQEMLRKGVVQDGTTVKLLEAIGKGGQTVLTGLQTTHAVLSATLAAAGTAALQSGLF